ncbi:MAG TPA: SDR family oxidoreductase [Acidimicrobiia bacterium]|jgi:NAD(P)-dependent dehydrogenase (short-subunit alcohol dehydrogenase family)|nr:SDR family oxidoreductase [Acidimicrobiia bacterium]
MSTAIITGASRGFGRALAIELARSGWNLVIDARDGSDLESASAAIDDSGTGDVVAIPGDVTDHRHAKLLVDAAIDAGGFSLLINNASMLGPSPQPPVGDYPLDVLQEVLATNLVAPLHLIQLSLPHLRAAGGTVVNITSDAAVEGYEGWGGYGSSKAALEQLSNVLAVEEQDITVYWLDPGDMNTGMHQEAFPGEDISDRPLPETRVPALIRLLEERPPSGRYQAEDLLAKETTQ